MIEQLKMDLKLHGRDIAGKAAIPLIGLILGFVMVCIILTVEKDETTFFCMGSLIAFMLLALISLVWCLHFPQEYMLALSMGRTRIAFLFSYAVRSLMAQGLGYLIVLAGYALEQMAYPLLFPGYLNDGTFPFLTEWWVIALAVPGVVLVQMFLGVLYGKYGKPFLLVAYFGWLGLCILGPQLLNDHSVGSRMMQTVFGWSGFIPSPVWIVIGICVVVAMAATVVIEGRKQMVR